MRVTIIRQIFLFYFFTIVQSNLFGLQAAVPAATQNQKFSKQIHLSNKHQIKVWIENGWLLTERKDAHNELVWRLPICEADYSQEPLVQYENNRVTIKVAEKDYFLSTEDEGLLYQFLRGLIQGPFDRSNVQFDPRIYGVKFKESLGGSQALSRTLWEKDGWFYFAVGGKVFPFVGAIFRTIHNSLDEGRMESFCSAREISFSWDDIVIYFDGQLIFVKQISDVNFERRLKRFQSKNENFMALPLEIERWVNKPTNFSVTEFSGKVVLLCFGDVENETGIQQLEKINAVYERLKEKNFEVVVVCDEAESRGAIQIFQKKLFSLPLVTDKGGTAEKYQVGARPVYFLIDKTGKIRRTHLRFPPDIQIIEWLLAE